jgi:ADP-ribosyl-[dinitrogen reductase] hydrolase
MMLVELAVGDSYGAGFEFTSDAFIAQNNDLSKYRQHPKWEGQTEAGHYTDDTQMTIAVAEALLSGKPWTKELLADKFVECYKRDPRNSYARAFNKFLTEIKDGTEMLQKISPKSDKSGAAMRASPLGLLPKIDDVLSQGKIQASVTHDTPDGTNAALAASLMVHYFAYDLGKKADLGAFIGKHVPNDWTSPWAGKVGVKGWQTVKAAITVVARCSSLSEVLRLAVSLGGDVDTVCVIAMSSASLCGEIKNDIPLVLKDSLENGPYGRDYLAKLDKDLFSKFGISKTLDDRWSAI